MNFEKHNAINPIEHIYFNENAKAGEYKFWVNYWYQKDYDGKFGPSIS